jgi:hypothetical protein
MEKFNPNADFSCAKCGHNSVEVAYNSAVTVESKEHTKWECAIGPEHLVVFCKRCSYEIGKFRPLNEDVI